MSTEQEGITSAVLARVRSFEATECARDAEGLVAYYACVPEFYFYHDGRRATHEVMSAGIRKALPAVRSLNVTYADVEVSALGSENAMASAHLASVGSCEIGRDAVQQRDASPLLPQHAICREQLRALSSMAAVGCAHHC